ncbi:SPOR domain-containing protein [Pseudazoarcus pumilus]|uniref:SPOR domain-containing protein n=1 Tax=Pseudazoarcus pumilus TaxID=2067960 RepID=A0A2I6S2W8_9RHOO|nr:SPOR domain-containing protein [Pseudazoarcus pumilus]AUN93557.1 hypothetical protein C0099_00565 [Pseudazoarcus pumilus]
MMNLGAEYGLGADTTRGALLRAAVGSLVLIALLVVATGDDEKDPTRTLNTPQASPSALPAPIAAEPDASGDGDTAAVPGAPVSAQGAPSSEPPRADALASAEAMPGETSEPAAIEAPADAAAPTSGTAQARPEPETKREPEPEPSGPTKLAPRPPAIAVADAPIVTVIPTDAASGPDDPPPPPPVPAVDDHRVRLGGFMPISDARALQQASADAGYPARVLHRVLLGPFAARAEARSARSGTRGILIGGGDEWWVQLGVFADADNAEGLREKMSAEGRAAVVQGRVDLGPFAGRAAAEQVLVAVRSALGRPLEQARIVAP